MSTPHLAVLALAAAPLLAQDQLTPIFDGQSLAGWEVCNGSAKFAVENGAIVGTTVEGSPNSFLCTRREYGDFVLELEIRNDPQLNSGIQIRSHRYEKQTDTVIENQGLRKRTWPAGRVYGYQVEIANEAGGKSGGIFDEARRGWLTATKSGYKDNQWNRIRVEARADSIRTWVNGEPCSDIRDSADQAGFIALQVHEYKGPKPLQVRFRNIRLQDLGRHAWKPLNDGRSFNGWQPEGGGKWAIESGAFHGVHPGAGKDSGVLATVAEFADFTARLHYKILKGNSGVFFRMSQPPAPMYEVEVDPGRDPGGLQELRGKGWLVHPDPAFITNFYRPGEWNEMWISAHAGRIVVHVNGRKAAEYQQDGGPRNGRLALQINPRQELDVWYRDLQILTAK
jgi:hypothetical protein